MRWMRGRLQEEAERQRAAHAAECEELRAMGQEATEAVAALEARLAEMETRAGDWECALGARDAMVAEARAALAEVSR